jgi:hypothetical protein
MYPSSKSWISPKIKQNAQRQRLNMARRKVCPRSPFWSADFDLEQHRKEWEAGRTRLHKQRLKQNLGGAEPRLKSSDTRFPVPPTIRCEPFNGKDFDGHYSPVLCMETIFCPQFEQGEKGKKNIAPWPSKSEMKYEGDDRISTDQIHGRVLAAPRVEGNETVNWQMRGIIGQYSMDDFLYPPPDDVVIMHRIWWIGEFEFTDEQGEEAVGKELMGMLDPEEQ